MRSRKSCSGGRRRTDGEIVVIIGWGFAGVAAVGGVAFLTKMALRKPKRRTAKELVDMHEAKMREERRRR
jgi:hypothetical protein